jgi:cytochrome c556
MRNSILLGLAMTALSAYGQQDEELQQWMKAAGPSAAALAKLENKTGKQAVLSAERLGAIYENMINFWRQRNAADAVKFSTAGKAAALQLASAARAGDDTAAASALRELTATCKQCHDAHREKIADASYRIK